MALVPISVVPLPAQSDHLRTIGGIVHERHAAGLRPRAGRIGRDADRAGSLCCQFGTAVIGLNEPTGNGDTRNCHSCRSGIGHTYDQCGTDGADALCPEA